MVDDFRARALGGYQGVPGVATVRRLCPINDESCSSMSVAEGAVAVANVGGVAIYDESAEKWEVANGTWPGGLLEDDVDLDGSEVASVGSGGPTLLLVTGVLSSAHDDAGDDVGIRGQLLTSGDLGHTWSAEADTMTADTPVAVYRNMHPWGVKDSIGGRLIEPVPSTSMAFVASHVPGAPPVLLREATGTRCKVDSGGVLPSTTGVTGDEDLTAGAYDVVSALAWYPGDSSIGPTLLIGYRQRVLGLPTVGETSLYRCDFGGATPACSSSGSSGATCYAVPLPSTATDGIDVSDIEVDDSGSAFVADYGRREADGGAVSEPGVWRWDLATDNIDLVSPPDPSSTSKWYGKGEGFHPFTTAPTPVTGLLVDPTGGWVYAFTPNLGAWLSSQPPIWRLALSDARSCTWSASPPGCPWITLSEDKDKPQTELDRDGVSSGSDTWFAQREPLANQPKLVDAILLRVNGVVRMVGGDFYGIWAFDGYDDSTLDGYDGPVDEDTVVRPTLLDNADYGGITTFQTNGAVELAYSPSGRLDGAVQDLGWLHQDAGGRTERSCQLDLAPGGVAIAEADSTAGGPVLWIAFYQQSSATPPKNIDIVRVEDPGGASQHVCFQGAYDSHEHVDPNAYPPHKWLGCAYDDFYAGADPSKVHFDDADGDWEACDAGKTRKPEGEGLAFRKKIVTVSSDTGTTDTTDTASASTSHFISWGNPRDIVALNDQVAVAVFRSYSYTEHLDGTTATPGDLPGRLAWTEDGGATWNEAPLDMSLADTAGCSCTAAGGDTSYSCTDEEYAYDIFSGDSHLAMVPEGHISSATRRNALTGDWQLTFFLDAEGDAFVEGCNLWSVTLTHAGSTSVDSNLLSVVDDDSGCALDAEDIRGLEVAPWSSRLMLWSIYTRQQAGSTYTEHGGACLVGFDGGGPLRVIDPSQEGNEFTIAWMAPHPFLQDAWFVAPRVQALTESQCIRERGEYTDTGTGTTGYRWENDWASAYTACDEAVPFLVRLVPPGSPMGLAWTAADLPIDGLPSLEALFMTTWSDYDPEQGWSLDELAYSTGGSGAFRGVISW